jgi:hypothetical protein
MLSLAMKPIMLSVVAPNKLVPLQYHEVSTREVLSKHASLVGFICKLRRKS